MRFDDHLLPDRPERDLVRINSGRSVSRFQPSSYYDPDQPFSEDDDSEGLWRVWQALWRRKTLIVANTILCALAAFFLSRMQTPVYEASTALEVQGVNENFMNMADVDPLAGGRNYSSSTYLQGQLEILSSRAMIERVISKLDLEGRPEFMPKAGLAASLKKAAGLSVPPSVPSSESAVAVARDNLKLIVPQGSRVIRIQYSSTDPKLAADFPNTLAQEYIEGNLELRLKSTQHTAEWLNRQLAELKGKLEKSEEELQSYAQSSGLLITGDEGNVSEAKLKQLQEELSRAQADRISAQSRYELLKQSPPDSLPEALLNPALRQLQMKLTDLRRQLADLRALLTPKHYRVKQIQAQVNELEAAVDSERSNIARQVTNTYQSARRREEMLSSAYDKQARVVYQDKTKSVHYRILRREADTNRQLYDAMLQKVREASMATALRASHVVVFDPAVAPSGPYKPKTFMNTFVGLLLGLFCGVAFVLIRERADRSFKVPGDSTQYLGAPELGVILSARADSVLRGAASAPYIAERNGSGVLAQNTQNTEGRGLVELATWGHSTSQVAESFRATLASILFTRSNGSPCRMIVFTSPNPGEGKTTVVSNLGVALSRIKPRVLVVDGDMRRPRIHDIFSLENNWGLSDFLGENRPCEDYPLDALVRETEVPNLCVLTGGTWRDNSSDLLHSPRLERLLDRFRQEFDSILIDSPPVMQVADARILSRLSDAVVLVCRAGETHRESAQAAAQRLAADGAPLLGTILNDWKPETGGYSRYKYYNRYGKT